MSSLNHFRNRALVSLVDIDLVSPAYQIFLVARQHFATEKTVREDADTAHSMMRLLLKQKNTYHSIHSIDISSQHVQKA